MSRGENHQHPILSWYEYDEVHRIEIRQGDRKIDRFYGYETEEDVKRQLRANGHSGEFEVIGIDERGNYLPSRGEIVVAQPGRPLTGLLARTSHYRGGGEESGATVPTKLLEHDAERQRQAAREREAMLRRQEEMYEERLEEREEAAEERIRIAEEAAEEKVRLAEERAARIEEESRREVDSLRDQSTAMLDKLQGGFDDRTQATEQFSQMQQSILSTTLTAQVKQAQADAQTWRDKYDHAQNQYDRLRNETYQDKEQLRSELERERARLRERYEDLERDVRNRWEAEERRLIGEHRQKLERLEDKLEDMRDERDELKDRNRELESKIHEVTLLAQMLKPEDTEGGLSQEIKDLKALLPLAKEMGADTNALMRDRLGMPEPEEKEEEKKSSLDKLVEGLLPNLLGGGLLTGAVEGGGSGGSSPSAEEGDSVQGLTLEPI
jgi:chromosome segregation ATPase